jgi:hypothetical protein
LRQSQQFYLCNHLVQNALIHHHFIGASWAARNWEQVQGARQLGRGINDNHLWLYKRMLPWSTLKNHISIRRSHAEEGMDLSLQPYISLIIL